MVSRYEVAMLLRQHWPLLNWKGDDHTAGVYFDEEYGYMVERSYAVRMKHDEPTSPAFYVPSWIEGQEDEVIVSFPYKKMSKRPNKYQLLFRENELTQTDLSRLFEGEAETIELPIQPLVEVLEQIPKKRERDLTWIHLKGKGTCILASIIQKTKDGFEPKVEAVIPCENDTLCITVNSNAFLHTLKLFSWASTVLITNLHDRIRVTNRQNSTKIEAVLSLPKKTIQKEIEEFV